MGRERVREGEREEDSSSVRRERERERERERQRDRQTDRQRERQTDTQRQRLVLQRETEYTGVSTPQNLYLNFLVFALSVLNFRTNILLCVLTK